MTWILLCEFNRRTKEKWDTTGGGVPKGHTKRGLFHVQPEMI